MVFVKNWKFKNCFVLIKRSLEEVSGDNLYSKNAIPNKKTVDLNKKNAFIYTLLSHFNHNGYKNISTPQPDT